MILKPVLQYIMHFKKNADRLIWTKFSVCSFQYYRQAYLDVVWPQNWLAKDMETNRLPWIQSFRVYPPYRLLYLQSLIILLTFDIEPFLTWILHSLDPRLWSAVLHINLILFWRSLKQRFYTQTYIHMSHTHEPTRTAKQLLAYRWALFFKFSAQTFITS